MSVGVDFSTIANMNFFGYVDGRKQPSTVVGVLLNRPVYRDFTSIYTYVDNLCRNKHDLVNQ